MEELTENIGVSLNETFDETSLGEFSLIDTPDQNALSLPMDVAKDRAIRHGFALGDISTENVEQLQHKINSGQEGQLRQTTYIEEKIKEQEVRQQLVAEYVRDKSLSGGSPTAEDVQTLYNLNNSDIVGSSPEVILEQKYAQRAMNTALSSGGTFDSLMDGTVAVDDIEEENDTTPEERSSIYDAIDNHIDIVAKQKIAQALIEEFTPIVNIDRAEQFIDFNFPPLPKYEIQQLLPFFSWIAKYNASGLNDSGFLLGNSMENQIRNMYQLSAVDFEKVARETFTKLNSGVMKNPIIAIDFIHALSSYGASSQLLDNTTSILDFTAIPAIRGAKIAAKALKKAPETFMSILPKHKVIKDVTKALASSKVDTVDVLAKAGDLEGASLEQALKAIFSKAENTGQIDNWEDLTSRVPSLFHPEAILNSGAANMNVEQTNKLINSLRDQSKTLFEGVINRPLKIARLEESSTQVALKQAQDQFIFEKPSLNDAIRDVIPVSYEDTISGVDAIEIRIGDLNGGLFDSATTALNQGRDVYKLGDFNVGTQNGGWYISHTKYVDENSLSVRNSLATETDSKSPTGFIALLNSLVPFSGKKQVISKNLGGDFSVASVGSSGIMNAYRQVAQTIGKLPTRKDFVTFVTRQRDFVNPETGIKGTFSKTVHEFDSEWLSNFNRLPSETEREAYFTYTKLSDFDWVMKNIDIHKDKARQGIQDFEFKISNPENPYAKTSRIQGRVIEDFPNVEEDAGILLWKEDLSQPVEYVRKNLKSKKYFHELKKQGYRIILIDDFGDGLLRDVDGLKLPNGKINYILSKSHTTSPLAFEQIPYRPGGHRDLADDWLIRQPNIKKTTNTHRVTESIYYGDRNIFSARTEKEARTFASKFEEARKLYQKARVTRKVKDAKSFVEKNLHMKFKDFARMFSEKFGYLDIEAPTFVTAKGRSVGGSHNLSTLYENLRNYKDSEHNLYKGTVDLQHALERGEGITGVRKAGTEENPLFSFTKDNLLDPFASLDNAMTHLLHGRLLDDLKVKTTENFIAQFAPVLKTNVEELRRDPLKHLVNPDWKDSLKGSSRNLLAAAKNYRRAAMEFLDMRGSGEKFIDTLRQKVADEVLAKLGEKTFNIVNPLFLKKTSDPITFMKMLAFDTTMGCFNVRQLFVQSMTILHATAIKGPVEGTRAVTAATFAKYALMSGNKNILKALAKKVSKLTNFTEDQFIEAYEALLKSNWHNISREVADIGNFTSGQKAVQGNISKFRDNGRFFFKQGEQYSRLTSWFAAYQEWRKINPTKKLDGRHIRNILDRADAFSGDMTAASNATWQKGWMSLPTQFTSWSLRIAEQLLPGYSTRLSKAEKLRAFMTYGALFGFPVALTAEVGVWPIHKEIKKELITRGIETDDNMIAKFLNDGMSSIITEQLVGTKMNIGESFGPSGLDLFYDLTNNPNTGVVDLLLGVGGSKTGEMIESLEPFAMATTNVFRSDDKYYPLTQRDWELFAANISSLNNGLKAWYAINMGEYISKNETLMDDKLDGWTGIFMGLTGTSPQRVSDAFTSLQAGRDLVDAQRHARKELVKEFKLMMRADDPVSKINHGKRVKQWFNVGGFRPTQARSLMGEALRSSGRSMIDIANKKMIDLSPDARSSFFERIKSKSSSLRERSEIQAEEGEAE